MEINLKTLNPEQKKAVTYDEGPLLIVAGAGTGKTTVISQRVGWLMEQEKAKPDEVLALTFTEKAAAEMEERVDKLLPYGYIDLWISTFHAFAERILKLHALEIGVPNDFRLLNQTEQWMLVRQNLDRFDLDYYRPLGNPTKFIHALIKLFSRAKDEAITPQQYLEYVQELKLNADNPDFIRNLVDPAVAKTLGKKEKKELIAQEVMKVEEVAGAYHTYQQLLLEKNALDFGDLINYTLQLFKARPALLAKYRNQFKYILVDEFQDTNHAQYELVRLLAAPRNNITVVGDDDQAIYKFRGASVSNILEFKKDYPKAAEVLLVKNYRSSQNILDLAYKFITQNNPDRLEVKLAKIGSPRLRSGEAAKKLSKHLKAQTTDQGVIAHLHFKTGQDEIRGTLETMVALKDKDRSASWADFAVLARTNDAANSFALGLSQTQIPYRFVASRGLYTKPVIVDVLAYLRLLDDYHESEAVYRVLHSPMVGLEHQDLINFNYWARRRGYSLYKTIQLPEVLKYADADVRAKIGQLVRWVEMHTALAQHKSVGEVVVTFLQDTGYAQHITQADNLEMVQNASYLNQFYKKITEFERSTPDASVKNFLQLIDLELEAGEAGALNQDVDDGPDAVKVMTVHAAKGLEFKYVFIVNLVDRRFPIDDRSDPIMLPDKLIKEILPEGDAHIQEERRLFYVAMTRAKRQLYFTSAVDYGGARKKKPSRFLLELEALGFGLSAHQAASDPLAGAYQLGADSEPTLEPEAVARMLPTKFSFTQLKLFERDPYQYWLEYILKIPQKGKDIFSFGTTLHATLQQFFLLVKQRSASRQQDIFGDHKTKKSSGPAVSLDELLAIYRQKWVDDWYSSRERHDEFFARGKKALQEFYTCYVKELPEPKYLEQPFNLRLQDPASGQTYTIIGKIDRVDRLDGGIEIIDYKTGQGKTEQSLGTDDKQQLLIYQLAAEQSLGEAVEQLTYYYLETGRRVSFVGTEKEIAALQKKIIGLINEIRSATWPPPRPS